MEKEVSKAIFDFSKHEKKIEHQIEKKPLFNEARLKNIKTASFIFLGCISIGVGLGAGIGLTNGFVEGYKISQEIEAQDVIKKNDHLKKIAIENDKEIYRILFKNRDDIIRNYEEQVIIYDKSYQKVVKAVKDGVIGLQDLIKIRELYISYKSNIHERINYVSDKGRSFEIFNNLDLEGKEYLKHELLNYQNGSLHRNSDLENLLLSTFSKNSSDNENEAIIRENIKNKMIDDMADILNNENITTKTKKIKN